MFDITISYLLIGCLMALFLTDHPPLTWRYMNSEDIAKEVIMYSLLWPIFVAGMLVGLIYGFFKGRRK